MCGGGVLQGSMWRWPGGNTKSGFSLLMRPHGLCTCLSHMLGTLRRHAEDHRDRGVVFVTSVVVTNSQGEGVGLSWAWLFEASSWTFRHRPNRAWERSAQWVPSRCLSPVPPWVSPPRSSLSLSFPHVPHPRLLYSVPSSFPGSGLCVTLTAFLMIV